jgi:hypothetical protein
MLYKLRKRKTYEELYQDGIYIYPKKENPGITKVDSIKQAMAEWKAM